MTCHKQPSCRLPTLAIVAILAASTALGCGGDDDSGSNPGATTTPDADVVETDGNVPPDTTVGDATPDAQPGDAEVELDQWLSDPIEPPGDEIAEGDASKDTDGPNLEDGDSGTGNPETTDVSDAGETVDPTDAGDDTGPDTETQQPPVGPLPEPGDLLITEIMVDPSGLSDADAEWIEIHNTSAIDLEISACTLSDQDNDLVPLGDTDPVFIPAGATWVLGPQGDASLNGGVTLDLVYPPGFWLSNTEDEVEIFCLDAEIASVKYDAATWPLLTGRALSLDPSGQAAGGLATSWCPAPNLYSVGNYGSPGAVNPPCPEPDSTIDDCILVEPTAIETPEGAVFSTSALIYDEGVTDVTTGVDGAVGLLVEAGYGPSGTDPSVEDASWSWQTGVADPDWIDSPNPEYDRYVLGMEAPATGDYLVTYRVSLDAGTTWTHCDSTGSGDGFSPDAIGALTTGPDPCDPNPCQDDPAPFCEGNTLVQNAGQGTCAADGLEAACSYDQTLTDCEALGGSCDAGACQDLAVAPGAGEAVITEVMKDPDLVGDAEGEWFEVANVTDKQLNLSGCELLGVAEDVEHVIDSDGALLAQPGAHLVFARDGDTTINGGVTADYVYAGVSLGNGGDTITLRCGGVTVDSVSWDGAYPDDAGAAMQLSPDLTDATSNDDIDSWCGAPQTFGDGDYGSPGLPNPPCYVDPCADVLCPETFPPNCDEETAVTYSGGTCIDGICQYEETLTDCTTDGLTCWFGECMTAAQKACEVYCGLLNGDEYCTGDSAVDFGDSTCLEACAQYPSQADFVFFGPEGEISDYPASGDTLECRLYHITEKPTDDPAIDCAAAAPDGGGVCVDPCDGVVCDDGLDCTEDSCAEGECTFAVGSESCLIEGACYGTGEANPGNPCASCDPGALQDGWTTSADGDSCGDLGETCQGGTCLTVCETLDCNDSLDCTADGCVEGECAYEVNAGSCLIAGACYGEGDLQADNSCMACTEGTAQDAWSPLPDDTSCGDAGETCQGGSCLSVCDTLNCDDSLDCTTDSCGAGVCSNVVTEGACLVDGVCYAGGDSDPTNPCADCAPLADQNAWSALADDTSCGDAGETCQEGACLPSCDVLDCGDGLDCTTDGCESGACTHTLDADKCLIDGACYEGGELSEDLCMACAFGNSQDSWSPVPDGATCGDAAETCLAGVCTDPCDTLDCDDALDCTTDICTAGLCTNEVSVGSCLIEGTCWADGDTSPANPCVSCDSATAQDVWSNLPLATPCGDEAQTCDTGVCVHPCDLLTCDSPPAPSCDAGTLTDHVSSCVVQDAAATCVYTPQETDCFPQVCAEGACVSCDAGGDCSDYDTITCDNATDVTVVSHGCVGGLCESDSAPGSSCEGTAFSACEGENLTSYGAQACEDTVGCSYPMESQVDCASLNEFCVTPADDSPICLAQNAVCTEDAECVSPPAGTCDVLVATSWSATGTCGALVLDHDGTPLGLCTYTSTEEDCGTTDFACAAGTCVDPCSAATCDTPDAPSCDGDTLTTYAETGTCTPNAGVADCAYEATLTDCTATDGYCEAGACVPTNRLLVVNELDYDMDGADDAEFIEVFNPSAYSIPLESLRLQSINGSEGVEGDPLLSAILDTATTADQTPVTHLAAGAYLVVGMPDALAALPADVPRIIHETSFLQNSDEAVRIVETSDGVTIDAVIDAVSYEGVVDGASEGGTFAPADAGQPDSLSRCPDGQDTNDNSVDFVLTPTPTPGLANACDFAPPAPTYTGEVQAIYQANCGTCHTVGNSGGTNFGTSYADAIKPASPPPNSCDGLSVAECTVVRILDGTMPLGGGTVSDEDLATLEAWLEAGTPE